MPGKDSLPGMNAANSTLVGALLAAGVPARAGQSIPARNLLARWAVDVDVVNVRIRLVGRVIGTNLHNALPCVKFSFTVKPISAYRVGLTFKECGMVPAPI
ncbi:hypothetical protein AS189_17390 [Arthrobacter alpinus]|uniref:Uncharacterized protein n=1 Tax=Arthrobacter alpinus TaxID=656366 RepID=A0A0S2M2H7_9MICC|nr:hypothetical protein AS189_17390 [Arthrobacter alpinus]